MPVLRRLPQPLDQGWRQHRPPRARGPSTASGGHNVAQGQGQGIGYVGWLRGLAELEHLGNHPPDLLLTRAAVAGERALHQGGGIGDHLRSALPRRQADYPSRMAHEDGGARVGVLTVEILDHDYVGWEGAKDLADEAVELVQPLLEGSGRVRPEDATLEELYLAAPLADDPVARHVQAGVNAGNADLASAHRADYTPALAATQRRA